MTSARIPNRVLYVVGDVIGSWYYSHSKLNTLFAESGAPGDPPEGNCVEKCQAWFKRANADDEINAFDLLGKVLVEFMSQGLHSDPRWEKGFERIQAAFADSNLAFNREGRIIPAQGDKRFRVGLSFAGEYRAFIKDVATHLASHVGRERVLYDKFYEAEFARPDLDTYLPNLYRTACELIAVFLCADYAKKRWCNLEWRFIRQLICTSDTDRIMFLSFDDLGAVPEIGILSGDGYVSIGKRPAQEIADLILQRLEVNIEKPGIPPGQGATLTTCAGKTPPPPSSALNMWQKKLAFLQAEEAKAVDAEQKFAIRERTEEAKDRIRELDGETR